MKLSELFTFLYELFHYAGTFSDDLFEQDLYLIVGLINVGTSVLLGLLFYYAIDNPKFSKLKHWLIILTINALIAYGVGFFYPFNIFETLLIEYQIGDYSLFAIKNVILSFLWFVLSSYLMKWWSTNAKGTPKFFGKF